MYKSRNMSRTLGLMWNKVLAIAKLVFWPKNNCYLPFTRNWACPCVFCFLFCFVFLFHKKVGSLCRGILMLVNWKESVFKVYERWFSWFLSVEQIHWNWHSWSLDKTPGWCFCLHCQTLYSVNKVDVLSCLLPCSTCLGCGLAKQHYLCLMQHRHVHSCVQA